MKDEIDYDELALTNLFSKYGFDDGNAKGVIKINNRFAKHLNSKGFQAGTISTAHNPRVAQIMVNGIWYDTDSLQWGPPDWKLTRELEDGSEEEIPVPKELEEAILEFVPEVNKFLKIDNLITQIKATEHAMEAKDK